MAKKLTGDEVAVNLRRKARHRLIGAVAVTMAVVVILPMVLDNEPKPATQDIVLRIPSPDKVGEFAPDMTASPGMTISKVKEVAAASTAASSPIAASAPLAAVSGVVQPVTAKAAAEQTTPVKASSNGKSKSADAEESFVAQVGSYSNADSAKQEALRLKKMGFKAYTEKVGNKIRVRVGPYVERERAEKARQLLENHGLHPVVLIINEHGK